MNSQRFSGLTAVFALLVAATMIWWANANNVQAPAGYAAYVIERPIFGETRFDSVIIGPSSSGKSWRRYGDLVSLTPYSYGEEFAGPTALIAKDKLAMIGSAHVVWRQRPEKEQIELYMTKFGGLDERHSADQSAKLAYDNYIKEPFRTLIREEFAKQDGLDVPDHINEMGRNIAAELTSRLEKTPFEIIQVVIGNAQPPANVLEQISIKVAKKQEEARKPTELNIANKNKEIEKANGEAEGERALAVADKRAEANNKLNASITAKLLQYQAIENMRGAQKIYLQLGPNGLPVVGNLPVEAEEKK